MNKMQVGKREGGRNEINSSICFLEQSKLICSNNIKSRPRRICLLFRTVLGVRILHLKTGLKV